MRASLAAAVLAPALCLATSSARAQTAPSAATGIYLRTGFALSAMDPSALEFSAGDREARRHRVDRSFTGKQFGWSRGVFTGGSLGVVLDARWFSVRIGAELYAAPGVPGRFSADVITAGWAALGPRYAWGNFAVYAGARFGAVVMGLRSATATNAEVSYSAVHGTYAAEAAFQWRLLRWLEVDAAVAQDFSALGVTTVTLAASFGWSRRP